MPEREELVPLGLPAHPLPPDADAEGALREIAEQTGAEVRPLAYDPNARVDVLMPGEGVASPACCWVVVTQADAGGEAVRVAAPLTRTEALRLAKELRAAERHDPWGD